MTPKASPVHTLSQTKQVALTTSPALLLLLLPQPPYTHPLVCPAPSLASKSPRNYPSPPEIPSPPCTSPAPCLTAAPPAREIPSLLQPRSLLPLHYWHPSILLPASPLLLRCPGTL